MKIKTHLFSFALLLGSLVIPTFSFCGVSNEVVSATHVYKTVGDLQLRLFLYELPQPTQSQSRPAVVFFHGGGFRGGRPTQFTPHCQYLASRGMVAMTVEYRLLGKTTETPLDCIADARSAIRWARSHAKKLGIDPDRIAAGGGSAGGCLAACAGLISEFDEEVEDKSISADANAMILFNPGLNVTQFKKDRDFGKNPKLASPYHNIRPGAPPTVIFHGTDDKTVLFQDAVDFTEAMRRQGNRSDLEAYEGRGHAFFNYRNGKGKDYADTVRKMDRFLESLDYLKGEPTI